MNQYLLSIMKGQRSGFTARLITCLLIPFSWAYGRGLFLHQQFYRWKGVYKAPKPVISIGNITVGGAGKTPLVIWLAKKLQEKGLKSVILTRGYMPQSSQDSDEAGMLKEQMPHMPVLVGADRVRSILKAKGVFSPDVYICDDAFQHWPLGRDLNIVAIDAVNPFGNGYLLPAGNLREPLSALGRADILVLTKTDGSKDVPSLAVKLKQINPKALIVESRYKSTGAIDVFASEVLFADFLRDKRVIGFCAIGDPLSFESQLKNSGAKLIKTFAYGDHYVYKKEDIQRMLVVSRMQDAPVLVTTHKDAVKLRRFKGLFTDVRLVYIPIELEITRGSDEFIQKVISVCRH